MAQFWHNVGVHYIQHRGSLGSILVGENTRGKDEKIVKGVEVIGCQ